METPAEDAGLTRRPMLASSWDAARGVLAHSLRLTRADLGARDLDREEPLTPPAAGREPVVLKSGPSGPGEQPCFLHLSCEPGGGEEVVAVGLLSSARNMEVYVGEEYCGTSRGKAVCGDPGDSEDEKIILYKKYLKLESSTHACKIKLLSFGEKQHVFISKIVVQLRRVSANSSTSSPALGSRIDLQRVQTLMEAMGSKLSPGAQQLMNMVKFQQQNCVPVGEQLQAVLGNTGYRRVADLQSSAALGASDKSPSTPFPFRTGLTSGALTEDLNTCVDKSPQPPDGGNTTHLKDYNIVPPNHSLLENDLRNAVSSFLPKKASDISNIPNSELLPFLQNLCSQVNHLRVGHSAKWQEGITKAGEGVVGVATGEQPVCSYLEKILTKNMELLEKKLVDSMDQRIRQLQEHVDRKMAVLMDLLQNPPSPPPGTALTQCDSGERLSNGER